MSHPVDEILRAQKRGERVGIPSICSAHPGVLKTALRGDAPVLIESTCNQVNQTGGYTGMTPADFARFVHRLAAENDLPPEKVILGGDHLGPSPWQDEPAEQAMRKGAAMVQAYVHAGFTKIHLDASMRLGGDDQSRPPDMDLAARRSAVLAHAAEEAAKILPSSQEVRYVIGTEVPTPGGATAHEDRVHVTTVKDAQLTLEVQQAEFTRAGLEGAWGRVIALVVQPGVEFGDDFILDYDPEAARSLASFAETIPMVYEAHSTDYQQRDSLRALVRDHFAILKVGPALTATFRQAVFSLVMIEEELVVEEQRSHLVETLEAAMLREPRHWEKHYRGTEGEQRLKRKYSLSDRSRYYWTDPAVQAALARLFENLAAPLPLSLVSQHLPDAYRAIRSGRVGNTTREIVTYQIESVLEDYTFACG